MYYSYGSWYGALFARGLTRTWRHFLLKWHLLATHYWYAKRKSCKLQRQAIFLQLSLPVKLWCIATYACESNYGKLLLLYDISIYNYIHILPKIFSSISLWIYKCKDLMTADLRLNFMNHWFWLTDPSIYKLFLIM